MVNESDELLAVMGLQSGGGEVGGGERERESGN